MVHPCAYAQHYIDSVGFFKKHIKLRENVMGVGNSWRERMECGLYQHTLHKCLEFSNNKVFFAKIFMAEGRGASKAECYGLDLKCNFQKVPIRRALSPAAGTILGRPENFKRLEEVDH